MGISQESFDSIIERKRASFEAQVERKREILARDVNDRLYDIRPDRIRQGDVDFLNPNSPTNVTLADPYAKNADADSTGIITNSGDQEGIRALGLDTWEHSFYSRERKMRPEQVTHYARIFGVPESQVTPELIFAMGKRADDKFNELASAGQFDMLDEDQLLTNRKGKQFEGFEDQLWAAEGNIKGQVTYDPGSKKWLNDKRAKVSSYVNPATGVDVYAAMNTPEFNTRWFARNPKQIAIREQYESIHGTNYNNFKPPTTDDNVVVGYTQHGRKAFRLNGETVSEKSTTIEMDGRWLNVPTIWEGKQYSIEDVKEMLINNEIQPTSIHKSKKEATVEAASRTKRIKITPIEEPTYNMFERKGDYWDIFQKSVSSGVDNVQATAYGFAALIADRTGNTEFADTMLDNYLANIEEAQRNGANLPRVEDVDWSDPTAALSKIIALVGEAIPSIGLMVGTGGLAGAAAKYGAKKKVAGMAAKYAQKTINTASRRASTAGAFTGANILETGSIYGDVAVEGNRSGTDALMALTGGSLAASLEILTPLKLMQKWGITKSSTKEIRKILIKNGIPQALRNIGKELLKGGSVEALTEGAQFVIEETTQDLIKSGHLPEWASEEFMSGLLNSVAGGFAPGAVLRGGTSVFSETSKQLGGEARVIREAESQIQQEAVDAENATVTDFDIGTEKVLTNAVNNVESSSIELTSNDKTGNTLNKALDYINTLNQLEEQNKTEKTDNSTAEIQSLRNELISAVEQYQSGEATTQVSKATTLNLVERQAKTNAIENKYTKLIAKNPDKEEQYLEAKQAELDKVSSSFNKKQDPVQTKAKPGDDKFNAVIKRHVNNSVRKIKAITSKLKGDVSAKQRKRLEQERNNLGLLIKDLDSKSDIVKETLNSFDFQHVTVSDVKEGKAKLLGLEEVKETVKQLNVISASEDIKKEDVSKGIEYVERLDKNAEDIQELLDTVTDKKERTALIKILKETTDALAKHSSLYAKLKEADNAANVGKVKTVKPSARKRNTSIKKRKQESVKNLENEEAKDDKLKSLDILYSLDPHTTEELNKINSENFNAAELKLLALQKKLAKLRQAYQSAVNSNSELVRVSEEIEDGKNTFFTGLTTYLEQAQDDVIEINDFNSFVEHIIKKANVFTTALAKANEVDSVVVSKDTLKIVKQTKDGKYPKNEFWWIREETSKNLVEFVNIEAEMGGVAQELIELITGEISTTEEIEIIENNEELVELGKLVDEARKAWSSANESVQDAIEEIGDDRATEELLLPELIAKLEWLEADLTYWDKAKEVGNKEAATVRIPELKAEIKKIKADIKHIKANPNTLLYDNRVPYEKRMEKKIAQLIQVRDDISDKNTEAFREIRAKINAHRAELKKFRADVKTAEARRRNENHLLVRWKNKFLKLFDTTFTTSDLLEPINIARKSIYSQNNTDGLDTKIIKKIAGELGIKDTVFINYLTEYFTEFKQGLTEKLITENVHTGVDKETGAYINSNPLNLLYITDDKGNITLPDEVIFAMMVSTIKWTSMNIGNMNYRQKRDIGILLQGDPKYKPKSKEYKIFSNMGIIFAGAANDIGAEVLNALNIKASIESAEEAEIHEILNKISPSYKKNSPLLKDAIILNNLKVAVGSMSLKIAATIKTKGALTHTKYESDAGLITIVHGQYPKKHFKDTEAIENTDLNNIEIKTIKLRDVTEKDGDIEILKLLESFNNNTDSIKLLNGSEGTLSDILSEPATAITHVKNSLSNLPKKVVNVIQKLNNVEWTHKDAMAYFNILDDENMYELAGISSVEDAHITEAEGVEASNNEKLQDIKLVHEYNKKGIKSFFYKWVAQKQHRLLIRSVTINGQRSKIHRGLFKPAGHDSVVSTPQQRLVHKIAVAQALGFKTDGNTLDATLEFFDFAVESSKELTEFIKSGKQDKKQFNKLLKEFLAKTNEEKDYKISASMHILEGITSLAKYDPDNVFTTDIMLETDAITNGYAIGLMQRLGVNPTKVEQYKKTLKKSTLDLTEQEIQDYAEVYALTDTLERIGIFAGEQTVHKSGITKKDVTGKDIISNYEEFILSGSYDTYQTLAVTVAEEFKKEDGYTAGKAAEEEANAFLREKETKIIINKSHIKRISTLFGEFFADGTLTKYARDFAKEPVLISGYGASVNRVIEAISEDSTVIIYGKFADFQVKYNKLVNTTGSEEAIKTLEKEVRTYEKDIRIFLGWHKELSESLNLVKHLRSTDNSKLKTLRNFTLDAKEENLIKAKVKAIYTAPVKTALDGLLKPMAEARDAMVKAGEFEALGFITVYDKKVEKFKTDNGKYPNVAQKLKIAEELAPKLMPIYFGPWTDPDAGIELIKRAVERDAAVISTKFKKQTVVDYRKRNKKFRKIGTSDVKSIGAQGKKTAYKVPGNSTYTNMVQNMDFVNLASTIMQEAMILPIHDAQMSFVNDVVKNNGNYNNNFVKNTLIDTSFLTISLKRLEEVKVELVKEKMFKTVDDLYRTDSFEAKKLINENKRLNDKEKTTQEDRDKITKNNADLQTFGFANIKKIILAETASTEAMHTKMEKIFGTEGKRGSWVGQSSTMYIPESLFGATVKQPETTVISPAFQSVPNDPSLRKGSVEGDAKDAAMRKVADNFIGETSSKKSSSSTHTSAKSIAAKTGSKVIGSLVGYRSGTSGKFVFGATGGVTMLARNGVLKGTALGSQTEKSIKTAADLGATFVVGDMPGVDSQFVDYLDEIGANYTIYHTGTTPRIGTQPVKNTTEVVHKKGAFTGLVKRFNEIKKSIKRDEKATKRFGWVSTWYGPVDYVYSGITHKQQDMPKEFSTIARQLEKELELGEGYFNSALMNVFPKGKGISKHADDESIYIRDTGTIGSVATISLGGTSEVSIIPNDGTESKIYTIESGDLYVMPDGDFQVINKHAVGKATAPRISMTFRHIPTSQIPKQPVKNQVDSNTISPIKFNKELGAKLEGIFTKLFPEINLTFTNDPIQFSKEDTTFNQVEEDSNILFFQSSSEHDAFVEALFKRLKKQSKFLKPTLDKAVTEIKQNLGNSLERVDLNEKQIDSLIKSSDYKTEIPILRVFEALAKRVDGMGNNNIPLRNIISVKGAKKGELDILEEVRKKIIENNPKLRKISFEEFKNEVNVHLAEQYLLGFANQDNSTFTQGSRQYKVGDTFTYPENVYHNKWSIRYNNKYINSKHTHFELAPTAWGNLTYFPTGIEGGLLAGLIHEIQNDFFKQMMNNRKEGIFGKTIPKSLLQVITESKQYPNFFSKLMLKNNGKDFIRNFNEKLDEAISLREIADVATKLERVKEEKSKFFNTQEKWGAFYKSGKLLKIIKEADEKFGTQQELFEARKLETSGYIDKSSTLEEGIAVALENKNPQKKPSEILKAKFKFIQKNINKELTLRPLWPLASGLTGTITDIQIYPVIGKNGINTSKQFAFLLYRDVTHNIQSNIRNFEKTREMLVRSRWVVRALNKYKDLTDQEILHVKDNLSYLVQVLNKNMFDKQDMGFLEDIKYDDNSLDLTYFPVVVHKLIQEHIKEKGKDSPLYFSGQDITKISQVGLDTAEMYAGREELSPGQNIGPMYTAMSKIKGIKLEYVESIPGIKGEPGGYKINLDNYDQTGSTLFNQRDAIDRILGQADIEALTVLIDAKNQKQDTLPHEYAHHYIHMFRDSEIVQEGIKRFGTEEKLVQAIGEQVVIQEGEALNWWNKFVNWILDKLSDTEVLQILTDSFLVRKDLYKEFGILDNTQEDIQLSLRKKVKQKVKNIMDSESLQDNLDNIFDILGQAPDSPNFEGKDTASYRSHLKRILDEIIKNTGDKLGNTTVTLNSTDIKANGEANITQDSLTVNSNEFTPRTYAEQSGQEVYIHEILHILTRDALKTDTVFKNKVNNIRTRVRNILKKHDKPYEIFLHKNPDGSIKYLTDKQAEEDAAKEMYDYVFGENVPEEGVLDEFLAYSLTNQFLVKELSSMPATDLKLWRDNTTDTVIEKIVKLIFTVFEKISNKLSNKDMPANTAMELYVLTKDLVTINDRQRGRVTRTVQGIEIGKHLDAGNESIKKFFGEMVDKGVDIGTKKYFELVDKWTKDGKVNNFVANLLYSSKSLLLYASHSKFIEDHPRVKKLLNDKFKYFGDRTKDNFSSVVSDFTGNIDIRFSKLLFKSQKQVDINRNQDKAATVESLLDAFLAKDELTDFEQVALTKALLKPDISALITEGDYTIPEVMALLVDDVKLQQTIDSYYNKLNLSKFKDYAVQTDELAEFMVRGKVHNYEQYKNVHAIHNLSKKQIKGKNVVKDLNIYVTLLAIKKTEKVNREVAKKVSDREYAVGPDKDGEYHNGITHLLHFHYAIKQEVLEDGFHNNPMLVSKGYIADIIDEDVKMEFAPLDLETQRAMNTKEFKLVKRLGHITGVTNANMGLYASKNNPKSKRVKAIVSLTSMQSAGYTIKEIWANNPDTAKGINERFEAFKELQQSKKGQLDKDFTMLPILDEWGNTVNYSVHMNHALKEELLGQNLGFADVMATTLSRHRDKVASKEINVEVVQLLHEYKLENYDKNPNKFIDILSPAYIEEYFVPLPSAMKNEIMQRATEGKSPAFYLERKYLDYVFGYILPSISELAIFKWNPKLQRYARVAEKFWQEMVALAKLNIVVKIPIVPTVNFLSNFFTSVIAGVPPKYAVKHWKEGIIELRHYTEDAKKLKLLDLRIAGNPSLKGNKGVIKKRKMLLARMNSNPVAPFVEKGLFNSITEDINQNDYTYRHKIGAKIGKTGVGAAIKKHTKGTLFNIANQAYMGESTATFKAAMHFTQMSDFIARYTLYKYQTEQRGLSKDVAWKQMVDTFVSYDQPLNRYIQWGNDMGALFFIKYAIRIQRATWALLKDRPLNVALLMGTTQLGGLDIETIFESSFLTGSFDPTIQDLSKTFFEVVVPPGVEILSGEGF